MAVSCIAKWDGSDWSTLGSGMNSRVDALVFDGSGNLYAGGAFSTAGNVTADSIAKWNGGNWSALGSGGNGWVVALAVDGSGDVYAGGTFTSAGNVAANRIAKWDGGNWSSLGRGFGIGGACVYALAFDGSGNLYAGAHSPQRAMQLQTASPNGTAATGHPWDQGSKMIVSMTWCLTEAGTCMPEETLQQQVRNRPAMLHAGTPYPRPFPG